MRGTLAGLSIFLAAGLGVLSGDQPVPVFCAFDSCSLSVGEPACFNGGTCKMDRKTCRNTCTCSAGYTGQRCGRALSNSSSPAVTAADPNHTLCGGLRCNRGYCNQSGDYEIKCVCEKNWIGELCGQYCPLDCGAGNCFINSDGNEDCACHPNFTPESNCTEPKPVLRQTIFRIKTTKILKWVVGVCVTVFVVVIFLLLILGYVMWKKRFVFIMKIVYYFQSYEDDDGKIFDAFVSYKSSGEDETWVLKKLFPKLEKEMGFKVCVHFRDFVPGETIANNIISAVEKSRRTILVLSPSYVKSEFTRMEYQVAQQEMLKLRHRIIPIMLHDVTGLLDLDKNLKTIFESITYLEWPRAEENKRAEKFWKKLELSMPKKKNSTCEQVESVHLQSNNITRSLNLKNLALTPREKTVTLNLKSDVTHM